MSTRHTRRYIAGTGHALPRRVVTSAELDAALGYDAGWIAQRTGIRERRIEEPGVGVSRIATLAGQRALAAAGIAPAEVGCVILATSTPDRLLPPTAPTVAANLGIHGGAFDLAGACAGFVQALLTAEGLLYAQPSHTAVLVIGANLLSRRLARHDEATTAVFADGAGALALKRTDDGNANTGLRILGSHLASAGEHVNLIEIPAGGSAQPTTAEAVERGDTLMRMHDGPALLRHAVRAMQTTAKRAIVEAGIDLASIDWLDAHQANGRVLGTLATSLGMPRERVLAHLEDVGNTSAATIPIALDHAVRTAQIRPGQRLLLTAAGAGLTAAAAVLDWG